MLDGHAGLRERLSMRQRDSIKVRSEGGAISSAANEPRSRFEIEKGMCSSEEFGQEHGPLLVVRAQKRWVSSGSALS
jgi:hypothetical protein